MGRRAKPPKGQAEAKRALAGKSPKDEGAEVRDLEKRLAESLEREKATGQLLQEKTRALTETLEQQTATSEILRVISQSPTDVQPVFDAVAESAARLCESLDADIWRRDGDLLRLVAHRGSIPVGQVTLPIRGTVGGRAVLDGRTAHVADVQGEADEFPESSANARRTGFRTNLSIPLMREGVAIGAIILRRTEAQLFDDRQVALLQTFAHQAVIAIENVRLFTELQEKNRALVQALDQQTATSEILNVISRSPTDVQPVFDAIAESAMRLCDASVGGVMTFDGDLVHVAGLANIEAVAAAEVLRDVFPMAPSRRSASARAILTRAVVNIADVLAEPDYGAAQQAIAVGFRSVVAVPMLREGRALGAVTAGRATPGAFTDKQVALLQTFADQAVIAIENVRLFTELQEKNQSLTAAHAQVTEALEQQTATSEILRVISSSPTDVQPIFDTIAANAARLCGAQDALILRIDGDIMRMGAGVGPLSGSAPADFALPVTRGSVSGRAVVERRTLHVLDLAGEPEDEFPVGKDLQRRFGHRTMLATPLLREDSALGVICVFRTEVRSFMDSQIELLKTFADQAVIAIENVRLFKELEARNRELMTALDQQTATSEILRVISRSPTDVQPVFDAIVRNAVQLCDAIYGTLNRSDGELIHLVAHYGLTPDHVEQLMRGFPRSLSNHGATATAIRTGKIVRMSDLATESDAVPAEVWANMRVRGVRSVLVVPMLRDNQVIGSINVTHRDVGAFTETHVELLKTFADQAVIAIENVRLFTELREKNRALTEALDQQTATGEILGAISSSPTDVQPVFAAVVASAARLCDAFDAAIHLVDDDALHLVAHEGPIDADTVLPLTQGTLGGRTVRARRAMQVADMEAEAAEYPESSVFARRRGFRTILSVPLVRGTEAIGTITIRRTEVRPFTDRQVELLKTFADQAVIAIENVRLFAELQEKNRALTEAHAQVSEALEQQTATSEILRVISSSPTSLGPVFDAILSNAATLCEANLAALWPYNGEYLVHGAAYNTSPEFVEFIRNNPQRPSPEGPARRAAFERRPVHVLDLLSDPSFNPRTLHLTEQARTVLAMPLLRETVLVGVIILWRRDVRAFTDKQIALLQTFADQAVIAIENVRLFKELETRTGELMRSVGELRALGEVGQAISSTLDLQTVLSTIVARATQLTGVDAGVIYEYDEEREVFEPRATERLEGDIVQMLVATPVRKGQGATGRLAEVPEPIQVADVRDLAEQIPVRDALIRAGYRALLAVPLVREDHLIGGLTVFRKTPGEFAPETVDLLRTFATQSALAIQNARLFREIADKSRQLEVASQHKSEFLANMSHELRTPLNAIIGFSEVLLERMFGEVNDKQTEYLQDIYASGTHLLSLINDILDLSKIEAGRMELELTDFDLPTALDSALTLVRERAGRRSITLHTAVDTRLGQVRADERKIRQVVLNLLSNAIKFTPEGGRIDVRAAVNDGMVEVSVADTGVGIAPEDQEAVFEEFRQVGTADKKVEGTGLGLALSRKFIELHGGRIWVKSQVGMGSTFTFTIPVRREPSERGGTPTLIS